MTFVRYISGQPQSVELPKREDFAFQVERASGVEPVHATAMRPEVASRHYRDVAPPIKERRQAMTAHQVMSTKVIAVDDKVPVESARAIMLEHRFHHLPVLRDGCLVGIVSDRDLFAPKARLRDKVLQIMSHDVLTARPEARIADLARVMVGHTIGCVPIVNEVNKVVGIVTRTDLLRCIMHHAPIDLWI